MTSKKFFKNLIFSNFFFISSYSLLGLNVLFFPENKGLTSSIYFGMSIFGATQIGGVWLVSLLNENLTFSYYFMFLLRILGTTIFCFPNLYTIPISFFLLGLSNSLYYKQSRKILSLFLEKENKSAPKYYTLFSITTNLSFIIMPLLGVFIIKSSHYIFTGNLVSTLLAFIGITFFKKIYNEKSLRLEKENNENDKKNNLSILILDALRLLGFLFPYAFMMAFIAIKASNLNLSTEYSASLYSANGLIVVIFQLISLNKEHFKYSLKKYDVSCILALSFLILIIFSNYWGMVLLFCAWSLLEAYQLPHIEYHLFNARKYSGKTINHFLVLDALICFIGPQVAASLSK